MRTMTKQTQAGFVTTVRTNTNRRWMYMAHMVDTWAHQYKLQRPNAVNWNTLRKGARPK